MHRLRLLLVVEEDGDPSSRAKLKSNWGIPEDFMPSGISYLEKWIEWPVVPSPGHHMWIGDGDGFARKVFAVIHVLNTHDPYIEVQLRIHEELAFIIAYEATSEYPGFLPYADLDYIWQAEEPTIEI